MSSYKSKYNALNRLHFLYLQIQYKSVLHTRTMNCLAKKVEGFFFPMEYEIMAEKMGTRVRRRKILRHSAKLQKNK